MKGAINMLELAKRTNAKILQASTSEVYAARVLYAGTGEDSHQDDGFTVQIGFQTVAARRPSEASAGYCFGKRSIGLETYRRVGRRAEIYH